METERFESLAAAYGADIRRWPADDREDAFAYRAREPQSAGAFLAAAEDLDAALDAWRVEPASTALRDHILAAAPRSRTPRRGFHLWLSGAGLAAAAMAGVVVGMTAFDAVVSDSRADALLSATLSDEPAAEFPLTVGTLGAREA
jgi:hypothetical protein